MLYPQDKFAGSMTPQEFAACVGRVQESGFVSLSDNSIRRARLVLVEGVTVRELAEQESINPAGLYKPIRMVFRAQRREG